METEEERRIFLEYIMNAPESVNFNLVEMRDLMENTDMDSISIMLKCKHYSTDNMIDTSNLLTIEQKRYIKDRKIKCNFQRDGKLELDIDYYYVDDVSDKVVRTGTDEDIKYLSFLPVNHLIIKHASIGKEGIQSIAKFSNTLESLYISLDFIEEKVADNENAMHYIDEVVKTLFDALSKLRGLCDLSLYISTTIPQNDGMSTSLNSSRKPYEFKGEMLSDCFSILGSMRALKSVCIENCIFTNGMKYLTDLVNLDTLYIDGYNMDEYVFNPEYTHEDLKYISKSKSIRRLTLDYTMLPDDALKYIKNMPNLEYFSIDTKYSSTLFRENILTLKKLESLTIRYNIFPDPNDLNMLNNINLESLTIYGIPQKEYERYQKISSKALPKTQVYAYAE